MELLGEQISKLEVIATLFGIVGVWLTVKQNIWCYPSGIINVALYSILFLRSKLYADASLQIVYVIVLVYGWIQWNKEQQKKLVTSRTSIQWWMILIAAAAIATVLIGYLFEKYTDASLPFLDSALTVASLIAQWMIAKKKIENWILWIIADVIYVGMYIYKHLYLTSVLYAIFIPLAIVGWRQWKNYLNTKYEVGSV
jgi:nicotinamide mononucleotide transporter